MKYFISLIVCFLSIRLFAQSEAANWYFGFGAGIKFNAVKDIENNCGVGDKIVSVIGYPKFFTSNNDGVNDTWQLMGISEMFQPHTNITIYNMYGKLIKQLDPLGEGWNGLFNGQKLPSDDYWFSVTLQDGRVFKNHFTLKR